MKTLETSEERVVSPEDFHLPENYGQKISWYARKLGLSSGMTLSSIIKKELELETDYTDDIDHGPRIIYFTAEGSQKLAKIMSERNHPKEKVQNIKSQITEQVQETIHGMSRGEIEGELKSDKEISALKNYWEESGKNHSDWFKKTYGRPMILRTEHIEEFKEGLTEYTRNRDKDIQAILEKEKSGK